MLTYSYCVLYYRDRSKQTKTIVVEGPINSGDTVSIILPEDSFLGPVYFLDYSNPVLSSPGWEHFNPIEANHYLNVGFGALDFCPPFFRPAGEQIKFHAV